VIEAGIIPSGGAMAHFAGIRVVFRDVVGIRGSFKILLMAGVTKSGRAGINSICMTVGAGGGNMGAGQRIIGLRAVIETRRRPRGRAVAFRAGEAEGRRGMDRVGGAGEIVVMAGIAIRRRAGVSLAMAVQTVQACMSAGQRKVAQIMVEAGVIPGGGAMAHFAGIRVVFRDVVGIRGSFKILLMAGVAERGRPGIDSVDMTGGASGGQVSSGERVVSLHVVIKT